MRTSIPDYNFSYSHWKNAVGFVIVAVVIFLICLVVAVRDGLG